MSINVGISDRESKRALQIKNKFITFFIDNEEYGIEIQKIKEIIALIDITPIPKVPNYIKGVINLRGKVIPVIDLRLKFGLTKAEYTHTTSIIINETMIDNTVTLVGTIVDLVSEVIQLEDGDIDKETTFGVRINERFFKGIAKMKTKVIMILDIDSVLSYSEKETLLNAQTA